MAKESGGGRESWFPWRLRETDQACCAALLAGAVTLMVATWVYQGGLAGRIIDVDRVVRYPVEFRLDINQAGWAEWSLLPGIGEMLGKRIVASRQAEGAFRSHEDLLRVRGIGPRTLERIRPFLQPVPSSSGLPAMRPADGH